MIYGRGVAELLVLEDDATIGNVLASSLRTHAHTVVLAATGRAALSTAQERVFDLALLDLGLPDMDGVEVCRRLRAAQPTCVLVVLTARDEDIDVVVGLEANTDDYLTKPFRLAELLARVRAHLRRGPGTAADNERAGRVLTVGNRQVDLGARQARLGVDEISLRPKEFELLSRLAMEPDVAVSRASLMADVWDQNWHGSTKTLDMHVAALRRKLAAAAGATGLAVPEIVTLRAHGFRLQRPATAASGGA